LVGLGREPADRRARPTDRRPAVGRGPPAGVGPAAQANKNSVLIYRFQYFTFKFARGPPAGDGPAAQGAGGAQREAAPRARGGDEGPQSPPGAPGPPPGTGRHGPPPGTAFSLRTFHTLYSPRPLRALLCLVSSHSAFPGALGSACRRRCWRGMFEVVDDAICAGGDACCWCRRR
jgi:hypothetical protein